MIPKATCPSIQQIQDRSFSATVSHVSLCPNMDLLAVALDGNSIALFRLSWNRLATISVTTAADETITSLVWSPSGAHLAVGTSTGLLSIHSVDRAGSAPPSRTRRAARDSEPVATFRLAVAVSAILWTHAPNRRVVYADRSAQLVDSRLPAVVEDGLLFIGGIDGTVTILTTNLAFNIACVQLLPRNFSVNNIHIASDQCHCVAIGYMYSKKDCTNVKNDPTRNGSSTTSSASSDYGSCIFRSMRTDFLLEHWSEIERVSVEAAALQSQLPTIKSSIKQVEEAWSKGVRDVLATGIAASMDEAMREFTQAGSIWDELYDIFCGSRVHGAALHCLVHLIGEGGAKEYLRSFRAHDDDAETAITALFPLVQNLLSRASEYCGLICLADQFANIGVREEDVEEIFVAAEGLFVEVCDLSRELEATSNETEAFLSWLVIATIKASGEATTQSRLSSNTPTLGGKEFALVGKFFEKMTAISATGEESVSTNAIAVMLQNKLQPAIKRVSDASETIIRKPFEAVSKALPLAGGISLRMDNGCTAVERNWFILDGSAWNGKECPVIALTATDNGNLIWARCEPAAQQWTTGQVALRAGTSKIMATALITEDCMVLAMSRDSSDGEVHEIGVCNPLDDGVWKTGNTVVCREEEVVLANLDNTTVLNKSLHTTKTVSGCEELMKNAALNVNRTRSAVSTDSVHSKIRINPTRCSSINSAQMTTSEALWVLKRELRKRIRAALTAMPPIQRAAESAYLFERLTTHPYYQNARAVAMYTSMPIELDTSRMLQHALQCSKRLFLPRVVSKEKREMVMLEVKDMSELESFPRGAYSIPEPPLDGRARAPQDVHLDLIVVPGVAFDLDGGRCGNGMGFYDIFLAHFHPKMNVPTPKLISFGLSPQLVAHVPTDDTDWVIDEVIIAPSELS